MERPLAFHGAFVDSLALDERRLFGSAGLIVGMDGRISKFFEDITVDELKPHVPRDALFYLLPAGDFLIPGFVDARAAPTVWPLRGLGLELSVLDWTKQLAFPAEDKCADVEYAKRAFGRCVEMGLKQGTTTAVYCGTRHLESTRALADLCYAKGQRAAVGKANLDQLPFTSRHDDSVASSLRDTEKIIAHVRLMDPDGTLIRPALFPDFALGCSQALLQALGDLAKSDPSLTIHTQLGESAQEVLAARDMQPDVESSTHRFDTTGLLGGGTSLAHCTCLTEADLDAIQNRGASIVHCPVPNFTLGGGFMVARVRAFLNRGIKVGLGTEAGAGHTGSMLDVMRQAILGSNLRESLTKGREQALSLGEAFHLATLGGAEVCGLHREVGSFEVGKRFDALWVTPAPLGDDPGIMSEMEDGDPLRDVFDKFVMTGDDRNIEKVYVNGRLVKGTVVP